MQTVCYALTEAYLKQYSIFRYGPELRSIRSRVVSALAYQSYLYLRPSGYVGMVRLSRLREVPDCERSFAEITRMTDSSATGRLLSCARLDSSVLILLIIVSERLPGMISDRLSTLRFSPLIRRTRLSPRRLGGIFSSMAPGGSWNALSRWINSADYCAVTLTHINKRGVN